MADILLLGMGPTTLSALDSLADKVNVIGVVRAPDSGAESMPSVVERAHKLGITVFSDVSLLSVEALIDRLKPDCVVVSSYNRILSARMVAKCRFVNVHYSSLPRYRGTATVNWALINGEPYASITIHRLIPEMDAGNILFQQHVPIQERDTVADLYRKLNDIQRDHLADTVVRFLGGYEGTPQDLSRATFGCSRAPADGEIDWSASTRKIYCLVRALVDPFPGAFTYFKGRRLIVWKAEPVNDPPIYDGRVPGRITGISKSDGYVTVLTGDGVMKVLEVQLQGENKTAAANVIRSVRETLGLRMGDLLERIRILEEQIAEFRTVRKGNT
jgi:methionyl-tRNA formyltransferase